MKKIAIITGSERPIPATLGGATQTMMTHLIDVNEKYNDYEFDIYSYYEKDAFEKSKNYKKTKFYYYRNNKVKDKAYILPYRIIRKITNGRTIIKTRFINWTIKKIKEYKPDVIIVEGNYFQVNQLRRKLNIPIILHLHIDGINKEMPYADKITNNLDGIIVISEFCKNRVLEINENLNKKIYILKNTIDIEHFSEDEQAQKFRISFRKEHGIKENDTLFVYCGRINKDKGVKEALEAFIKMNKENAYMLIIGSSAYANSKKDKYYSKLEEMAKKANNKVIFTGYVSQKDLPKYYVASDVGIVPSLWNEAAGNVTVEEMACGLPVIATRQGGIPEYADEKSCALINADENIIDSLITEYKKMIDDKEYYNNLKNNARKVALKYDKNIYYNNFIEIIKKAMKWS